ncbi:MAG: triple tyrosine motif-containing protein, partial [Bacteroidota bacterium]
ISPFMESDFFQEKSVSFIKKTEEKDVYLIITESHGMFKYFVDTQSAKPWRSDLNEIMISNRPDRAITLPGGDIILGTIMDGIMISDQEGDIKHHINVDSGLQSNTVHGLASDQSGNIWLISDKGIDFISFLSPQSYVAFDHDEMGAVYSAALFEDYLYVGTNQGLFRRPWEAISQSFSLVPGTQRQVWDCTVIDDRLFVGHNSGTFLIDKNHTVEKISPHNGASSLAIVPNNKNQLIQSTFTNLILYEKQNGQWVVSKPIAGFNDLIQSVEFDHRGNLWASHPYRGIYRISLNNQMDSAENINYYGKNTHLGHDNNSLKAFNVDNRIVITNGDKLHTYDDLNDSIIPYNYLNENLGEYSSSYLIVQGFPDHYWFMNDTGIALYNIRGEIIEKIREFPSSLFKKDLIPRQENLTAVDEKKSILCLENGYALLDASADEAGERITKEKLTLRSVSSATDEGAIRFLSPYKEKITIPFSHNNLSFVYSFPLYSGEEINYQYFLEGLTQEWSEPLKKPSFTINRIPPGNYTLKVKATNNWQRSSAIHQITLTVNPPFYQSTIAYIIYVFLVIILFIIARYLIRRKVKLQEQQRWEEKEQELIKLRHKKLQSDLSFNSRQLATSALSMAKTNEALMEIRKKLTLQKEKLGARYPEKCFHEIIKKIDEGITGDDEWKIFEHNFNLAHETFLHNLKAEFPDLTPNDLRLCAFLRINLASKEIAPLLGISVRGVENHRYRLRKKLNLSADDDLTEFLFTFRGKQNTENNHY